MSSLTNTFGGNTLSHSYTYDANRNILTDGSTSYTYDSQNQLVWEYNAAAGKAWNYAYDLGGNILSKTEYDYADGQTSNPVTVSYTYGDAVWRDLLTAYNGETITYDGIGNPTSYRGWGMTWQGGRQLASMQKDGTTLSFAYNDAGLRTEKTVNGATRRYIWNSGRLMADVGTSDAFYFHYSSGGELIGYTYKTADTETECILVKNQQSDVERVISADGTIRASYTYDAWGNVLTAEGSLAQQNPIRYRGYYFDTETNLYYLQSRYYDPATGRFINADGYAATGQGIHSCNMYMYCENNPVDKADPEGTNPFDNLTIIDYTIIHAWVQSQISREYGWLTEVPVTLANGKRGRLDLYDSVNNEFYEVKALGSAYTSATSKQIGEYVTSKINSRIYPQYNGLTPRLPEAAALSGKPIEGSFIYGIHDVKYYSDATNPGLIVYEHSRNYQREAMLSAAVAVIAVGVIAVGSSFCPPALAALPLIPVL